ncbi:dolichol kinase isoform X2 [Ctenocephalides felis]|uniref:dolichol kinase isoform X2 n=1 Tax=Ctenocephalides felis TaxID=7515 RepID=UPI000E6E1A55|nr:dolichol kinase isoform X2 [Ctenocephalides felis]
MKKCAVMGKFSFKEFNENATLAFKRADFKLRPNASFGIWACMLLPVAIILSFWKHQREASLFYKLNVIAAIGICFINITILYNIAKKSKINTRLTATVAVSLMTSCLFWICMRKDWLYSFLYSFGVISTYSLILPICLYSLPLAFTFGEAAICAQGIVLFIFSAIVNILDIEFISCLSPYTKSRISDTILQVGILGICLIASIICFFKILQNYIAFYITTVSVILLAMFPMMHVLLNQSPIIWILVFMFNDSRRIYLIMYWGTCVLIAILLMYWQISGGAKASTALRKYFHILAVLIYVPGLIYECTLLYLASGVVFAIFIMIEIIRKFDIWPFGKLLQMGFSTYADEKDAAEIALTPIYLIVGCTLPMWIHPCPCDLTDSAGFNLMPLLAGLLSIGIGDTMASIIGSNFGRHKWKGSKKSVEGTLSSIIFQLLLVLLLVYTGFVKGSCYNILQSIFAIVTNALIEAKTDQVDNLVLPIITYILLL